MSLRKLFFAMMLVALCLATPFTAWCAVSPDAQPNTVSGSPCPRYAAGSSLVEAKDLFSKHGVLKVTLSYKTRVDADGNTLFCFMSEDGAQSPTLHVWPGDELLITLKNELPSSMTPSFKKHEMKGMSGMGSMPTPEMSISGPKNCGGMVMTDSSVN